MAPFKKQFVTSGCGSVGRTVASDSGSPRFESSQQQNFIHYKCVMLMGNL